MFKTRLLSGVVLMVVLLTFGIVGGKLLLAGLGIVSIIGMYELYRIFHIEKNSLGYVGYLACVCWYCFGMQLETQNEWNALFLCAMILIMVLMAMYVFGFPKYKGDQVMAALFGFFYVAVMLSCIYLTRTLPKGAWLIWLIFLCSWGCDTCAYCVGMLFGKHKMAPVLSPKKSIEGAVGGVVGSMLLTVIYSLVFREKMNSTNMDILILILISGIGAFISMVGDLAASGIKRNYGVKDYGALIPGHGGILDRFDSVIFTAPVIYFLALYFIG